jgi:replicative DNA helicase
MDNYLKKTERAAKRKLSDHMLFEHGKVPPQAVDLEKALLGGIMVNQYNIEEVMQLLKPEMFYKESHQKIYAAIKELYDNSEQIDLHIVINKLSSMGELDMVGGAYYIVELTTKTTSGTTINSPAYAKIITEKFLKREMIRISSDIMKEAFEETSDAFDVMDLANNSLIGVNEIIASKGSIKTMKEVAVKTVGAYDKRVKAKLKGLPPGVPTGINRLDQLIGGLQKSDLILIGARPSMGKTATALSMAKSAAVNKFKVAVFSIEMADIQIGNRMICAEGGINSFKFKNAELDTEEYKKLKAAQKSLSKLSIYIDDAAQNSVANIKIKANIIKKKYGLDMIIIDYIGLIDAPKEDTRELSVAAVSKSLKALAKNMDIPIVVLTQLNRDVEKRGGDKKPQLSDLRESGGLEQDADLVMFLWRPAYYNIEDVTDHKGVPINVENYLEIIVAKHRNGFTGAIKASHNNDMNDIADYNVYANYQPQEEPLDEF